MKNYRLFRFLSLTPYRQAEYTVLFKHAKGVLNRVGPFKPRELEVTRIDDVIEIKDALARGKEFKALNLFFSLNLNVYYPGVKVTRTHSDRFQGTERYFYIVKNKISIRIGLPRWYLLLFVRIQEYFLALNYLSGEVERISKAEARWKHYVSPERQTASGKRLNKYGHYTLLRSLAKSEGIPISEVIRWTWAEVDAEMSISADESWIDKEHRELLERKAKEKR